MAFDSECEEMYSQIGHEKFYQVVRAKMESTYNRHSLTTGSKPVHPNNHNMDQPLAPQVITRFLLLT